ncbi:MAG TPA: malonyl-ACP O-methyltransferase BioC [Steroidobacteraceae bacterium]|nr:malonyl-ACP O-methyltransferase BioC [Steroidobacteraceae bacterium]
MTGRDPAGARAGLLDRAAIRRYADRASAGYDDAAVLARELRETMLRRLDYIAFTPAAILDLGCGTGEGAALLAARWPAARIVALDFSPAMLEAVAARDGTSRVERVLAEAESLPFDEASFDLVFSNLMLPWCEDVDGVFAAVARVLAPRGLFTFSTLGPDTLGELRAAWQTVDGGEHVHPFTDMHDLGDGLVRAGFAEPVMDVSRYRLTYPDARSLMRDLHAIGAQNAAAARARGLTGRARLSAMSEAYESFRSGGVLPATWEAVFGQAWGATPAQRARRAGGEFAVPLDDIPRRRQ